MLAIYGALIQTTVSAPLGIQATFDQLYDQIALTWNTNAKTPKAGSNPTHWWTQECELAKHVYEHTCSNEDRKIYLNVTVKARKTFFDQKIQNMTAMRHPWEGMRWIGPRRPPAFPSIRDWADEPIKDPETLFQHMHRHFNSSAALGTINWHFIRNLPAEDERLSPAISCAEILKVLGSASNSSVLGGDHITWQHLKLVIKDERALWALASLFNQVIDEGVWLHQLKNAVHVSSPSRRNRRMTSQRLSGPLPS